MRIREALRLLRTEAPLRRYLLGVSVVGAARRVVVPFLIVLMRRELGFTDAEVALATVAYYGGGFVSLYLWGRVTDSVGTQPIFGTTAGGLALVYLGLLVVNGETATVPLMVGVFFLLAVLNAGFGVADTHVLFRLAPSRAPTRLLVVSDVTSSLVFGMAPLAAGLALEAALARGADTLLAYRLVFACCAAVTVAALIPLRRVGR
jgi:MFS family permease